MYKFKFQCDFQVIATVCTW